MSKRKYHDDNEIQITNSKKSNTKRVNFEHFHSSYYSSPPSTLCVVSGQAYSEAVGIVANEHLVFSPPKYQNSTFPMNSSISSVVTARPSSAVASDSDLDMEFKRIIRQLCEKCFACNKDDCNSNFAGNPKCSKLSELFESGTCYHCGLKNKDLHQCKGPSCSNSKSDWIDWNQKPICIMCFKRVLPNHGCVDSINRFRIKRMKNLIIYIIRKVLLVSGSEAKAYLIGLPSNFFRIETIQKKIIEEYKCGRLFPIK